MIELKAPTGSDYVFAEIQRNPQQLRFGIDLTVGNVKSDQMEVISQGTIVYTPLKSIR
jgi:hypothetical protein